MLQTIKNALSLLPPGMNSIQAIVLLLAIMYQESEGKYRRQLGGGPARGLWQFERGNEKTRGGISGVMLHKASRPHLMALCAHFRIPFDATAIWNAVESNDVFAAGVARLMLWTHAGPLPVGQDASWNYYESIWRPGKPRPDDWPENYQRALKEAA